MEIKKQRDEEVRKGKQWALRAMQGDVEGGHLPHQTGRTVEHVLKEAGWKYIDSKWTINRREYAPGSKYERNYNRLTYHSPDGNLEVSVIYIVGSRPATCQCKLKRLDEE